VPDRDDVLSYIEQAGGEVGEHDRVRAFGVKGRDRFRLKRVLRDLESDGAPRARGRKSGAPPSVAVLDVAALDEDGEPLARLASEPEDAPPRIRLLAGDGRAPAPAVGDRVLARVLWRDDETSGEVIRILRREPPRLVGLLQRVPEGLLLEPLGNGANGAGGRAAKS
jgi:ribonuclease R